jgi:hypothetical protein
VLSCRRRRAAILDTCLGTGHSPASADSPSPPGSVYYTPTDAAAIISSAADPVASPEVRGTPCVSAAAGGTAIFMLLADEFGVGIYEANVDTVLFPTHSCCMRVPNRSRTVSRSRGTRYCVGRGMIQSNVYELLTDGTFDVLRLVHLLRDE